MNLQKINTCLAQYKNYLRQPSKYNPSYKWESLANFQNQWDIEAVDFSTMFDNSFQNSTTKRLWRRENYDPKTMMLKFIEMQPEFVRFMFTDLFNEQKEVGGRVDRFVFHCDELLKEYKEQNPRTIENNHFHDDGYQMVSLYLSFKYPEQYVSHNFLAFQKFLEKVGAKNIPPASDFPRFCKVLKTMDNFVSKDTSIQELYQARLTETFYDGKTMLITEGFYRYTSGFHKN